MDRDNLSYVNYLRGQGPGAIVSLLMAFAGAAVTDQVDDPYHRPRQYYLEAYALIDNAVEGLVAILKGDL